MKIAFIAVTLAYWGFMLSDGALRMLVLLHFHTLGFSPFQLANLFVLYEIAGVVTNLSAGWIAARFGLASTLFSGLALQIIALIALTQLDPAWTIAASVVFVMCVQGLSGVAKDLAKMSSKSAVKILAPDEDDVLFKWVAFLTGSKNAIKGLGFFLGAAALGIFGFVPTIIAFAIFLSAIFIVLLLKLPAGLPTGKKGAKFSEVFSKNPKVNYLSLARVFLFGARDVWFVVGIPLFFYAQWSDGIPEGKRWAFFAIGAFMAVWVILYGFVQTIAPKLINLDRKNTSHLVFGLALIPLALTALVMLFEGGAVWLVIIGLFAFGALFALNSSLHSFLILRFTDSERVTLDVGFYYMANAAGRLIGTVLSGAMYQIAGLNGCLIAASVMLFISFIAMRKLDTYA